MKIVVCDGDKAV